MGNSAVGSVKIRGGSIVAAGRTLVNTTNHSTAPAEAMTLRKAAYSLGDTDITGCKLHATFQPCPICSGAMTVSRVAAGVVGPRLARRLGPVIRLLGEHSAFGQGDWQNR